MHLPYYLIHLVPFGLWVLTAFLVGPRRPIPAAASPDPAPLAYLRRHQLRHARVLGLWGLSSLGLGALGMLLTPCRGAPHQFAHMSAAWGSLNLPIAVGLGLYARRWPAIAAETATRWRRFGRFLLLNGAFDGLYGAAGWGLLTQVRAGDRLAFLFQGLGWGVISQAMALLALDTASWYVLRRYRHAHAF